METITQTGYTIGMWIAVPVLIIGVVLAAFMVFGAIVGEGPELAVGGVIVLLVASGIFFLVAWPFDMSYHQWVKTTGTVQSVATRSYAEEHGSTQYYGVAFTDGRIRKCGDMRCGLLKSGDVVILWCAREYQFGPADPGYSCDWGSTNRRIEG